MNLPTVPFLVSDFCATEPSSDLPTAADYVKLFFPPVALITGTYTRFRNQIYNWKFAQLCECSPSTGATCYYGYASYPHTWQNVCASSTCRWYGQQFSVSATTTCYGIRAARCAGDTSPFTAYLWDATSSPNVPINGRGGYASVVGDSLYLFDSPSTLVPGHTYVAGMTTSIFNFDNSLTRTNNAIVTYGSNVVSDACAQTTVPTTIENRSFHAEPIICDGGPPPGVGIPFPPPPSLSPPTGFPAPPAAPTCGTQQDICNTLNTINQKLDWMRMQVDLIQRQGVPFGYLTGAIHAGLMGSGTIPWFDRHVHDSTVNVGEKYR